MRAILPSNEATDDDGSEPDELVFLQTLRFSYHNIVSLVGISLAWVLVSLPVVTVGPATIGAYRAIIALDETGSVDLAAVSSTVRTNLVPSLLLGILPFVLGGTSLLYVTTLGGGGSFWSLAVAVLALYATLYLSVLLIPTFGEMARGREMTQALRESYVWAAQSPTTVVRLTIVTAVVFVISVALTIAVVAIFPGFIMTYQLFLVDRSFSE